VTEYGMGRIYKPDERDLQYLMRAALPSAKGRVAAPAPTQKTWALKPPVLNQLKTGTCVGHGWTNFLRCAPMQTTKHIDAPYDLYRKAVLLDDMPENDGEATAADDALQYGTTVRAGAVALTNETRLQQYLWAFDLATTIEWLLTKGPVVVGVNWYDGMFAVPTNGILKVTGDIAGGHCFLLRGANSKTRLVPCTNSWGVDWGLKGNFFLTFSDLERLIHEQGEVCTAVQQKVIKKAA